MLKNGVWVRVLLPILYESNNYGENWKEAWPVLHNDSELSPAIENVAMDITGFM